MRYRLVSADSGSEFVIPEDRTSEFWDWEYDTCEDYNREIPSWATPLYNGAFHDFTFTDPRVD